MAAAALLAAPAAAQVAPPAPATSQPAATGPARKPARRPSDGAPRVRHAAGDPLEGVNRAFYSVNTVLDRLLFRPLAFAYKAVVPKPVRVGIRHVFSNLNEPVVFVNDVLQLKPKRAARTAARFFVNSTLGIGGVLDVAVLPNMAIPHRDNGFGDTLGRYGVGPGPYFYFPLSGPTDLRDVLGGQADGVVLPLAVGDPFNRKEYLIARGVLTGLDQRVEADGDLKALLGSAVDPYATLRSVYLQNRAAEIAEIRHGNAGATALDDPLADPMTDPAAPATQAPAAKDAFDSTPADPDAAKAPIAKDAFDRTPQDPDAGPTPAKATPSP